MPKINKTSGLMSDGTTRQASQPRFAIGEEVRVPEGYTGIIVLSMPYEGKNGKPKYLIDCFPGAIGGYSWVWMKTSDGPDLLALNWLDEDQIKKIRKRRLT